MEEREEQCREKIVSEDYADFIWQTNVREEDILAWKDYNGLRFLQCACRFTEQIAKERAAAGDAANAADIVHTSKRQEVKELIKSLDKQYPGLKSRVFGAMQGLPLPAWGPVEHRRVPLPEGD